MQTIGKYEKISSDQDFILKDSHKRWHVPDYDPIQAQNFRGTVVVEQDRAAVVVARVVAVVVVFLESAGTGIGSAGLSAHVLHLQPCDSLGPLPCAADPFGLAELDNSGLPSASVAFGADWDLVAWEANKYFSRISHN